MKKRLITLIIFMGLLFILLYSKTTQAWFLDSKTEVNNFTTGTINMKLTETFQEPTEWTSGTTTPKIINIQNIGTKKAYVRVWAIGEWQQLQDGNWVTAFNPTLPTDNVIISIDSTSSLKWVKHTDGAYYYKNILNPNEDANPSLKLNVTFNVEDGDTRYDGKRLRIKAISEAVQVTHGAYLSVWGVDVPQVIVQPSP